MTKNQQSFPSHVPPPYRSAGDNAPAQQRPNGRNPPAAARNPNSLPPPRLNQTPQQGRQVLQGSSSNNTFRAAQDRDRITQHWPSLPTVMVGRKQYTVVNVIQPPSNETGMMSDGIRTIKDSRGQLFVEKRLRINDEATQERAHAEIDALNQINGASGSPHINRLVESIWPQRGLHASLILEFCNRGTLEDYISTFRGNNALIPEKFCWRVLAQISSALAMCHFGVRDVFHPANRPAGWNMICHLDVKPSNIFLDTNIAPGPFSADFPSVVLADFGCSFARISVSTGREVDPTVQPYGTEGWFPPEGRNETGSTGPFGKHTDIWQLGGVIQVMCRQIAMPDISLVNEGRAVGSRYSTQLNQSVLGCMNVRPDRRPTAVDAAKAVVQAIRDVYGEQ